MRAETSLELKINKKRPTPKDWPLSKHTTLIRTKH